MDRCVRCDGPVEARFRFCPWCAEPRRRKLVEFFLPHAAIEGDRGKALRVSRYLGVGGDPRHVRFSVWNDSGVAEAAVSLDEKEAERLVRFIHQPRVGRSKPGLREAVERAVAGLRHSEPE